MISLLLHESKAIYLGYNWLITRTAPIPGICIGIGPIPMVSNQSSMSYKYQFCCLYIIIHNIVFFQSRQANNYIKDEINLDCKFYSVSMYRYRYLYL